MSKTALIAALAIVLLPAPARAEPTGDQLEAAEERLEQVVEDYNEVREDLRDAREQAAALTRQLKPLERQLAARQAQVGVIATTAYQTSRLAPALAVINADTAAEYTERMLVLQRLAGQQQEAIDGLLATRKRTVTAREELDAVVAQRTADERSLAAKKRQIERDVARLERVRTDTGYTAPPAVRGFKPAFSAGRAGAAVRFAYAQLGKAYRFGASGPRSYDCSGLTSAAWARAGVPLPHNARRQYHSVGHISRADLRPGDLIFYYRSIHHVAIYAGGGKMIHAPRHGEPVRLDDVDYQPIHGYGRPSLS
ncbi:NlpC/P60 family protein [Actinomycetes bacterium KLBMP 9797]